MTLEFSRTSNLNLFDVTLFDAEQHTLLGGFDTLLGSLVVIIDVLRTYPAATVHFNGFSVKERMQLKSILGVE